LRKGWEDHDCFPAVNTPTKNAWRKGDEPCGLLCPTAGDNHPSEFRQPAKFPATRVERILFPHPTEQEIRMLTSGIVGIIVTLVVIGLVLYLIDLIPMDGAIKRIIRIIVIIAVVVWLLQAFGLIGSLNNLFHPAPVRPVR
jgi:hypothetical protein